MRRSRTVYLVPGVALVSALVYVLIYLYRWEWHRALVAGVFMLAVEIGLGFALVLERLAAIEARLDKAERDAADTTRAVLRETAPTPSEPFEWLSDAHNRMSVFVPILLGAGVMLSAMAWLVERVARLTSGPALERGLVLRLQPLTMPAGTLLGAAPRTLPALPNTARARSWRWLFVVLAAVLAVPLAEVIDSLMDATQNRPDAVAATSAGEIVVSIQNRQAPAATIATATSLWGACSNQIGTRYQLTGVERIGPETVRISVRPAIGKYAERRLRGCFEDATTDLIRADVIDVIDVAGG